MQTKTHSAKFTIAPRGRKTKYYTCQHCGYKVVATTQKMAREFHKQHLTKRAVDGAIWRCDYCDNSNQGSRENCWACGTPRN